MPTTSNFGWTTPADTDLVKDGAAAIRTLGNGIDTSLIDLKGGTTGQVLSKTSNTDLDYTWVTPNVGDITEVQAGTGISVASGTGPIPVVTNTVATTFDAKGDLVVGTGADTFNRLAVGTNGQILVANSSTSTGLEWQAAGGSDLVRITTQTFSAQTGVIFTDCFSSTYHNYLILGSVIQSQSASTILRLRNSGGDYTTADQRVMFVYGDFTNSTVLTDGATNRDFVFSFSPGTTRLNFYYWLFSPQLTEVTQGFGGRVNATTAGAHYYFANNSNSYPSLNLTVSAGTFSGEMSIYGYKRS